MTFQDGLVAILHQGAQGLLVPVIVLLVALAVLTLIMIGAFIVEVFTERRHYKVNHERVIAQMHASPAAGLPDVIAHANLLKPQVGALGRVARNMGLPDDELFALASVEVERADAHYQWRVNLTDTVSKVAPMLGLMGTLIPLGPGIVAMGQGDVAQLSSSMLVAFDTTVAGLIAAAIALVIGRVHKTWYAQYHVMLQALMSCVLEEAARARDAGEALPIDGGASEAPGKPAGPKRKGAEPGVAAGEAEPGAAAGEAVPEGAAGEAAPEGAAVEGAAS